MTIYRFLVFMIVIFLIGCNDTFDEKIDKVVVGMTYDEVENIVGKPVKIIKGSTGIDAETTNVVFDSIFSRINKYYTKNTSRQVQIFSLSSSEFDSLVAKMINETGYSCYCRKIESGGQLIETTWEFDISKIETTYYFERHDTVIYTPPKHKSILALANRYILNGVFAVDRDSYLNKNVGDWVKLYETSGGIYTLVSVDHKIFPEAIQIHSMEIKQVKVPYTNFFEFGETKFMQLPSTTIYQITTYKYRIVFDSASGRVKSKGFQPISVINSK